MFLQCCVMSLHKSLSLAPGTQSLSGHRTQGEENVNSTVLFSYFPPQVTDCSQGDPCCVHDTLLSSFDLAQGTNGTQLG